MDGERHRGRWRFVHRLWRLFGEADDAATGEDKALDRKLHQTIDGVAKDIEALSFNKAVARIYELANAIEKAAPSASRTAAIRDARLARRADGAPSRRGSLGGYGQSGLIADAAWPEVDPALLVDDEVTVAVQVMGKLRDTITVAKGLPKDQLEASMARLQRKSLWYPTGWST
jgi:leucyl-tRNA synthetase